MSWEHGRDFISANQMLAAAKGNGWRETMVTSAGTNFVRTSQTIANKHTSLWPARAANSLSDVCTEQSVFIAVGGVMVPRVPLALPINEELLENSVHVYLWGLCDWNAALILEGYVCLNIPAVLTVLCTQRRRRRRWGRRPDRGDVLFLCPPQRIALVVYPHPPD